MGKRFGLAESNQAGVYRAHKRKLAFVSTRPLCPMSVLLKAHEWKFADFGRIISIRWSLSRSAIRDLGNEAVY